MRESKEVPHMVEQRICKLAETLPSGEGRDKLMNMYSQNKGYEFMNPKSKLYRHFNYKCNAASEQRMRDMTMNSQVAVTMDGSLDQLSVGAMCEILKQNLRKGAQPYQPTPGQQFHQQIIFQRDQQLFQKIVNLLHGINLTKLQQKNQRVQMHAEGVPATIPDKIAEFRKQMAVKQDGSMGAWGGKKYEGLGVSNQFTSFRREQSLNYYQNTHHTAGQRKKP